jgi:hypothetical protein
MNCGVLLTSHMNMHSHKFLKTETPMYWLSAKIKRKALQKEQETNFTKEEQDMKNNIVKYSA